jgi:hypothetical protein
MESGCGPRQKCLAPEVTRQAFGVMLAAGILQAAGSVLDPSQNPITLKH